MNQLERIALMEQFLDKAKENLRAYSESLRAFREIQPKLRELAGYYAGEDWRKDFADDEAGRLPEGLKRGVLSEDGVYDVLSENRELQAETLEVMAEILRDGRF
ncbi:MAG: DUF4298 domain-containing protein [Synergistaceae bacterium]|nr:DUF4298 domain-containing protein [Synergistaceae bacterium]